MKLLRRFLIFCLWTCATTILLFAVIATFASGDCRPDDLACLNFRESAGQLCLLITVGIYGVGLGIMLDRWILNRSAKP